MQHGKTKYWEPKKGSPKTLTKGANTKKVSKSWQSRKAKNSPGPSKMPSTSEYSITQANKRFTTCLDGHTFLAQCHLNWKTGLGSMCWYHLQLELSSTNRLVGGWSFPTGQVFQSARNGGTLGCFQRGLTKSAFLQKWWTLDPASLAADGVSIQHQYSRTPKRTKTCFMLLAAVVWPCQIMSNYESHEDNYNCGHLLGVDTSARRPLRCGAFGSQGKGILTTSWVMVTSCWASLATTRPLHPAIGKHVEAYLGSELRLHTLNKIPFERGPQGKRGPGHVSSLRTACARQKGPKHEANRVKLTHSIKKVGHVFNHS